jgi:glycosyltransferase involved in cell wall biosynthesis
MRILMVAGDAFGGWGGIAKFNRDFVSALASHAATTEVVVVPRHITGPIGKLPDKLDYRQHAAGGRRAFFAETVRLASAGGHFDVIISGHINLAPFGWAIAAMKRAPVVMIIHGIDAWRPTSRAIANLAARRMDGVIAVSQTTLSRFENWAGTKGAAAFVLPNTVSLDRFQPGSESDDLLDRYGLRGRTVLMTLARLDANERYKGIDEVLGVLGALAEAIPDVSYLIVGDGSDRPRLTAEARRLGVADRVVFAGRVDEERKADHYRLADAFVMPGRGEGFGIVYLEALACGVPVVGSVLDGSRDALLDGRLGVLVDPNDRADLLRGIREALRRPKGEVPALLSEFSENRYVERVHAILDAIAGGALARA